MHQPSRAVDMPISATKSAQSGRAVPSSESLLVRAKRTLRGYRHLVVIARLSGGLILAMPLPLAD